MKVSNTLYAAADYIRKHGWAQGIAMDLRGGVCMVGAIRVATGRDPFDFSPVDEMLPARHIFESVCGESVVRFNNEHCRTTDDAIAALSICADIAAAEGN